MTMARVVEFVGSHQLFETILTNGLQEAVARLGACSVKGDERLLDQLCEEVKHIVLLDRRGAAHRLGGIERPATGKL